MSDAIRPLKPDGTVDTAVLARLSVRHDDSPENVSARLALWDRQVSMGARCQRSAVAAS